VDRDPLFILAFEDSLYDPKHAIPMATYAEITAFDEPQLLFTLFEQGDLDFKLVFKATQIIEELDQGRLIDQLLGKIIGVGFQATHQKPMEPRFWYPCFKGSVFLD